MPYKPYTCTHETLHFELSRNALHIARRTDDSGTVLRSVVDYLSVKHKLDSDSCSCPVRSKAGDLGRVSLHRHEKLNVAKTKKESLCFAF